MQTWKPGHNAWKYLDFESMPFGENSAQSPNLGFEGWRWDLGEDVTPHVASKLWLATLPR